MARKIETFDDLCIGDYFGIDITDADYIYTSEEDCNLKMGTPMYLKIPNVNINGNIFNSVMTLYGVAESNGELVCMENNKKIDIFWIANYS